MIEIAQFFDCGRKIRRIYLINKLKANNFINLAVFHQSSAYFLQTTADFGTAIVGPRVRRTLRIFKLDGTNQATYRVYFDFDDGRFVGFLFRKNQNNFAGK